jgi:2-iminobutanoate/2-iminopropanoate deaminase
MAEFHTEVEGIATPAAPYSLVVATGDLVFTSGQTPLDADGKLTGDDIEAQARQALKNLQHALAAAGLGPKDVVKVTCYLADMDDALGWNEAYKEVFEAPFPVRTTVGAALPGFKIEIEAVATRA